MTDYSISDGIAVISMDDSKANALNPDMLRSISRDLDRAELDRARLVVLKGRPGIFSAGLDLKLMPTLSADEKKEVLTLFGETACRLFMLPIPSVAAVTGHAIAGGAILAYACDRRFMLDGAFRLQLNEIVNGMNLPAWMLAIMRCRVPRDLLVDATLHSGAYTPAEAVEKGLVHGVAIDDAGLLDLAGSSCSDLLKLNLDCYARTKRRLFEEEIKTALAKLAGETSSRF